jgi:hypothetical protein
MGRGRVSRDRREFSSSPVINPEGIAVHVRAKQFVLIGSLEPGSSGSGSCSVGHEFWTTNRKRPTSMTGRLLTS